MSKVTTSMKKLEQLLINEQKFTTISFGQFLDNIKDDPINNFQNINIVLHDVIKKFMKKQDDEYNNDPQSIDFVNYDCSQLFINDCQHPFFADRLLSNYLIDTADSLQSGSLNNRMIVFSGPPGSGKSTFINNFLNKIQSYISTDDGTIYETVWNIDSNIFDQDQKSKKVIVPCPHHDHPILQVPKKHRKKLLSDIIEDKKLLKQLLNSQKYQWIFNNQCCPICSSIYNSLSERGISPSQIFDMLHVKRYDFSRKLGDGISIYNPGDVIIDKPLVNQQLQKSLDEIFESSDSVKYVYSQLAKTNNGIYVIMDVKSNNIERLQSIHGVISDGTNKVTTVEENINCIFMTIINPEDKECISDESFADRVAEIPIPYVRDYNTEIEIYKSFYDSDIDKKFLPNVLQSFVKAIIGTRLHISKDLGNWISSPHRYYDICDQDLMLLQMEIYSGNIPFWLNESDIKSFDKKVRKQIIKEGECQGQSGISGRDSVHIFDRFYTKYSNKDNLIDIDHVIEFLSQNTKIKGHISDDLLDSIKNNYQFELIQQIKEAMFFYNEQQIDADIKNYLFALSSEPNCQVYSPQTRQTITTDDDFFNMIEYRFFEDIKPIDLKLFRTNCLKKYVAKTIHQVNSGTRLEDTEQYKDLVKRYNRSLKQNVLDPFIQNQNFRRAVIDYGKKSFDKYDKRLSQEITFLMNNLIEKYNYTEKGAKQVIIYILDNNLADKFKNMLK